jgi:hypothetical protein
LRKEELSLCRKGGVLLPRPLLSVLEIAEHAQFLLAPFPEVYDGAEGTACALVVGFEDVADAEVVHAGGEHEFHDGLGEGHDGNRLVVELRELEHIDRTEDRLLERLSAYQTAMNDGV